MTKDEQIRAMALNLVEEAPPQINNADLYAVLGVVVSLALQIERGILYWDDEHKTLVRCATGKTLN